MNLDVEKVRLFYEELMKTPCKIYSKSNVINSLGIKENTLSFKCDSKCHYYSLQIEKSEFRDKVGEKNVYLVCLPLNTDIKVFDIIELGDIRLEVIGIRQRDLKFENVVECVWYE